MSSEPVPAAPNITPADVALIDLSGVTIRFDRPGQDPLLIVADFDLAVRAGQFLCIAGRSGSGKTSLLRVAAGLAEPRAGQVSWEGRPLDQLGADQRATTRRRLVAMMEQNPTLLPELTVLENVLLPAIPDRRSKELTGRARDLLTQLGLDRHTQHRPDTLSGGERQRLALARALLLDPPVIITDEPTASLDRGWADHVIDTLAHAANTGTAVLAASHDPNLTGRAHTIATLD